MRYQYLLTVWSFVMSWSFHLEAQVSFGRPEKINEGWRFILEDRQGAHESSFDDSKWEIVDLPHDWSIKQFLSPTLASAQGYFNE